MEEKVQNYFVVFLLGLGAMITFHNTILSAKKYLTRHYGKVSDMLRIVCNFGSLWRFIISLGYFMTPSDVTSTPCKALGYLYLIGYHLFHISLYAFLLWNIYRMSLNKKDLWLGIALLLIQTSLVIPEMIFVSVGSMSVQQNLRKINNLNVEPFSERYCEMKFNLNHYRWTTIISGFVIMFYAIIRLSYLAKNRRRNVVDNVPTTSKSTNNDNNNNSSTTTTTIVAARRPLSLPTIYWTLALSILTFMLMWLSSSSDEKPDRIVTLNSNRIVRLSYKTLLYILVSYVITYLDGEKRKDVIFYSCGGNGRDGSENARNSANKLDGEAWVICSKKEKKKDTAVEMENNVSNVSTQV